MSSSTLRDPRHRSSSSSPALWGALALAVVVSGCGSGSDDAVILERAGLLTVEWSIAGSLSPQWCGFYVVDAMELVVYDRLGRVVLEAFAPCEDFILTVDLPPGLYDADATLVGFSNEAATLTEPIDGLRILLDSELVVSVDYPRASFL